MALARSDKTVLGKWWWSVDWWTLGAIAVLMVFGIVLVQAATPAVAVNHGWSSYYFVERHVGMLVLSAILMFGTSLLSPKQVRQLAAVLLVVFLALLVATLFIGVEIKGARRWIHLPGFSIQPSEFVKPMLAVTAAWLFSRHSEHRAFPGLGVNIALYGVTVLCLLGQPDIGMTVLVSLIWFGEFFLAGLPLVFVGLCSIGGIAGLFGAYYIFPHFASRLDRFLTHSGDTYQTDRALDAFAHGGIWGVGPGAGTVKMALPDAHADFIFAVAGEELGFFWCAIIVALFLFIVLRSFWRAKQENNLFVLLATCGLVLEFGMQAAINLASTTHLMPAKGMTLPFISYGGSSMLALGLGMGMLLALTRKRFGLGGE